MLWWLAWGRTVIKTWLHHVEQNEIRVWLFGYLRIFNHIFQIKYNRRSRTIILQHDLFPQLYLNHRCVSKIKAVSKTVQSFAIQYTLDFHAEDIHRLLFGTVCQMAQSITISDTTQIIPFIWINLNLPFFSLYLHYMKTLSSSVVCMHCGIFWVQYTVYCKVSDKTYRIALPQVAIWIF